VDLQTTSRVEFIVPFVSQQPYKTVQGENTPGGSTGMVYVFVLNQLVHPSNVAPLIQVNMYISAEDDFELAVPLDFPLVLGPLQTPPQFEPTGLTAVQDTVTEQQSCAITTTFGGGKSTRINRFGETFDLPDLIKRFGRFDGVPTRGFYEVQPGINFTEVTMLYTMCPVSAVAQMFATWYGSLRYKILFDAPRTAENVITINYSFNNSNQNIGAPVQITNLAQDSGIEFETPCYVPWNVLVVPDFLSVTESSYQRSGYLTLAQSAGTPLVAKASYMAAGDDLQFFYMIAPPTCLGPLYQAINANQTL